MRVKVVNVCFLRYSEGTFVLDVPVGFVFTEWVQRHNDREPLRSENTFNRAEALPVVIPTRVAVLRRRLNVPQNEARARFQIDRMKNLQEFSRISRAFDYGVEPRKPGHHDPFRWKPAISEELLADRESYKYEVAELMRLLPYIFF